MEAFLPETSPEPTTLVVADLSLDLASGRAWRGSRRLRLAPREIAVLKLLMLEPGRVWSRAELYHDAWGSAKDPTSNLVDATICHLRSKVDWGHRLRLIHTLRGEGYVLEPHLDATPLKVLAN